MSPDPTVALLAELLAQAFDRPAWHGPNLRNALRGLDAGAASWRPGPGRHNAWEEAVHCAYWKYRVVRLVDPSPPAGFGLRGSDWFERPDGDAPAADWAEDLARLERWHARLLDAVEALDPARLDEVPGRGRFTVARLLMGAASHDVYHAGQIRLLRRLSEGG